jgi:hypothetical protein
LGAIFATLLGDLFIIGRYDDLINPFYGLGRFDRMADQGNPGDQTKIFARDAFAAAPRRDNRKNIKSFIAHFRY